MFSVQQISVRYPKNLGQDPQFNICYKSLPALHTLDRVFINVQPLKLEHISELPL